MRCRLTIIAIENTESLVTINGKVGDFQKSLPVSPKSSPLTYLTQIPDPLSEKMFKV